MGDKKHPVRTVITSFEAAKLIASAAVIVIDTNFTV